MKAFRKENNETLTYSMSEPQKNGVSNEKTREEVMREREARKKAKQNKKGKALQPKSEDVSVSVSSALNLNENTKVTNASMDISPKSDNLGAPEKTEDESKVDNEFKKQANKLPKEGKTNSNENRAENATQKVSAEQIYAETQSNSNQKPAQNLENVDNKKKALTKAERRAIQEAQRAAKALALAQKQGTSKSGAVVIHNKTSDMGVKIDQKAAPKSSSLMPAKTSTSLLKSANCKVRLFNHIECARVDMSLFINNPQIHPCIARLGEQYAQRTVIGSNARCVAFLNALKMLTHDFETPPKKEFARSLEGLVKVSVEYLQKCRPLAASVVNAYKHIKQVLTQLPTDRPESELKEHLCHFVDSYLENQIGKAAQAISDSMQEKITNGDVILTFGCSSLIHFICEEAHKRNVNFRVIVVDSRPFCEGQELLRRLNSNGIPCSYVLINAVGFVMPEATKVLLGAHSLLSNGYVMARTGTAQVALVAHSYNVPVLVCCETHKFSERFQTDAIVYNEIGNPDDLILSDKCCLSNWQAKPKMTPLNLLYDITPPELVTAVVTEVSILPCTSVPVILRIKPTEIGYYC